jgi:hypothetical protein
LRLSSQPPPLITLARASMLRRYVACASAVSQLRFLFATGRAEP